MMFVLLPCRRRFLVVITVISGYVFLVLLLHIQLFQLDTSSRDHTEHQLSRDQDAPRRLWTLVQTQSNHVENSLPQTSASLRRNQPRRSFQTSPHANSTSTTGSADDYLRKLDVGFPVVPNCRRSAVATADPDNINKEKNNSEFQSLEGEFFYTAYLDTRLKQVATYVRVIALLRRRINYPLAPNYRFRFENHDDGNDNVEELSLPTEMYEMCENHGRSYGGWIVSAKLPVDFRFPPPCHVFISIDDSEFEDSLSKVEIRLPVFRMENDAKDSSKKSSKLLDFAICVPPLFGDLTAATLIQFIEMSRLLGAQHFVFYVQQVSDAVLRVLDWYVGLGLATSLVWRVPVASGSVWYNGQLLAINDCLYRTAHSFRHVIFNDVDELLVPHHPAAVDWTQMMAEFWTPSDGRRRGGAAYWKSGGNEGVIRGLWSRWRAAVQGFVPFASEDPPNNLKDVCGYKFQSAFFETSTNSRLADAQPSYDLSSVQRSTFSRVRTKVMVLPAAVFELGIHHVSRPLFSLDAATSLQLHGPTLVIPVPPDQAFIHHYRQCTTEFDVEMDCYRRNHVTDDRIIAAGYLRKLKVRFNKTAAAVGLYGVPLHN